MAASGGGKGGEGRRTILGCRPSVTGLPHMVWLRRERPGRPITIEITDGEDYADCEPAVLLVDPLVLQIAGPELDAAELHLVGAWAAANADAIEAYWEGRATGAEGMRPLMKGRSVRHLR